MSIATMSAKVHALTPTDELIGSLTKERIKLLVQEAGNLSLADAMAGKFWLAYVLNTDIPASVFDQLASAFLQAEMLKDYDLEYWFDVANTEDNRESLQYGANMAIDQCVAILTNRLATQLGVTA